MGQCAGYPNRTASADADARPIFTLTVGLTQSLNGLLRSHWREQRQTKTRLGWELLGQLTANIRRLNKLPLQRCCLTITRHAMGVEPDHDNLVASGKLLLDALQDVRVIGNDSPGCIGTPQWRWTRVNTKAEQRTTIAFYRADDETP